MSRAPGSGRHLPAAVRASMIDQLRNLQPISKVKWVEEYQTYWKNLSGLRIVDLLVNVIMTLWHGQKLEEPPKFCLLWQGCAARNLQHMQPALATHDQTPSPQMLRCLVETVEDVSKLGVCKN